MTSQGHWELLSTTGLLVPCVPRCFLIIKEVQNVCARGLLCYHRNEGSRVTFETRMYKAVHVTFTENHGGLRAHRAKKGVLLWHPWDRQVCSFCLNISRRPTAFSDSLCCWIATKARTTSCILYITLHFPGILLFPRVGMMEAWQCDLEKVTYPVWFSCLDYKMQIITVPSL